MFEYLMLTSTELIMNSSVLMAFAFAISIIALSFMAGEFMSMPSIKGFARAELYELGVTAVIFVLLLLLILPQGPFDMVAAGFGATASAPSPSPYGPKLCDEWKALHGPIHYNYTYGSWYAQNGSIAFGEANYFLGCKPDLTKMFTPSTDPMGMPSYVMDGVLSPRLMKGYTSLMLTQMFIGLLSGFSTSLTIPAFKVVAIDISFLPWVMLNPLNQAHTMIVDLIGTAMAAVTAQNMLLKFIEAAALPIFLPFGLMLRAFPFTRKTGSTIIAVVVAAYFIYPISILIDQQIWVLIVDPPGPQGCFAMGISCQKDLECCSYSCRAGKCASPLTDFSEYRSMYSICSGNPDQAEIAKTLAALEKEQNQTLLDMYFSGDPAAHNATQTEGRLDDGLAAMSKRHLGSALKFGTALMLPLPGPAAQTVFSQIEALVMDASQYVLLTMIFVVVSIVISLTMLKDIAILLGGEPRIFGLSKLV